MIAEFDRYKIMKMAHLKPRLSDVCKKYKIQLTLLGLKHILYVIAMNNVAHLFQNILNPFSSQICFFPYFQYIAFRRIAAAVDGGSVKSVKPLTWQ